MTALKKLFEPIKVGRVDLKNRLVMAPVTDNLLCAQVLKSACVKPPGRTGTLALFEGS